MASFPFVVGSGRSGTTLVRALLDAHPLLAVPPESNFVPEMGAIRSRYERPDGLAVNLLVADLFGFDMFRRWNLNQGEVIDAITGAGAATFADAVRALYAYYAKLQGKDRYGDKTPRYVLSIGLLAEVLPESSFLHVLRDGRDVALSMRDVSWAPDRIGDAAMHWRQRVRAGRAAGRRLGPGRYIEIRYEELIADPEKSARAMCEFIDIPFDPVMLDYAERARGLVAALWHQNEHQNITRPPTKGLRDWRTAMTPGDLAVFEAIAGSLLGELGYDLGAPEKSATTMARAAEVWARNSTHFAVDRAKMTVVRRVHPRR